MIIVLLMSIAIDGSSSFDLEQTSLIAKFFGQHIYLVSYFKLKLLIGLLSSSIHIFH